ncbi:MAG: hypothetical protein JW727_03865 [Candidatus Aenigmarchaeota archaeon]|nr:hypothetical protein [Candidatus Aenigmarchaeota archaeon]
MSGTYSSELYPAQEFGLETLIGAQTAPPARYAPQMPPESSIASDLISVPAQLIGGAASGLGKGIYNITLGPPVYLITSVANNAKNIVERVPAAAIGLATTPYSYAYAIDETGPIHQYLSKPAIWTADKLTEYASSLGFEKKDLVEIPEGSDIAAEFSTKAQNMGTNIWNDAIDLGREIIQDGSDFLVTPAVAIAASLLGAYLVYKTAFGAQRGIFSKGKQKVSQAIRGAPQEVIPMADMPLYISPVYETEAPSAPQIQ